MNLKATDLSYASLPNVSWWDCHFTNTLCRGADVRGSGMTNCTFLDVDFDDADLRGSMIGGCEEGAFTEYTRCSFRRTDLRETIYEYPTFADCDFSNAKLGAVDFGWSRFTRCRFAGRLKGVWFRGTAAWASISDLERYRSQGIDPSSIVNRMEDVDFTEAYLDDVSFTQGIDLSTCKFPVGQGHIIVKDRHRTFAEMEDTIRASWHEPARSEALRALDIFTKDRAKKGQQMDVINRRSYEPLLESEGRDWGVDFFDLMEKAA